MQSPPPFGHEQIVTELIRGVLDTVADNPLHSPERRASVTQTVVSSLMSYNPRDPIETMLAGQCIVYDAVMRDGARDLLRGQAELLKLKARPGILAAGKIFLETTEMIVRMQGRAADQLSFARPLRAPAAPAETPAAQIDATSEGPAESGDAKSEVPTPPDHAANEPPIAASPETAPVVVPGQPAAPAVPSSPPVPSHPAMNGAQAKLPAATASAPVQPAGAHAPDPERPRAVPTPAPLSETVDDRLLEGFTPEEQRDIREAIAGAARLANQAPAHAVALRRAGRP
jgi:hypothetical protein